MFNIYLYYNYLKFTLYLYITFLLKFLILFYSIVTFIKIFAFLPFIFLKGRYLDKLSELLLYLSYQ